MEAYQKFFAGIVLLLVAGVLCTAMMAGNSGSAADWSGAIANFAAVATALWLASSERRRKEEAERLKIREARVALRDWLQGMTSLVEVTTRHMAVPGWIDPIIREEIRLSLQALTVEWMQINDGLLPKDERRVCNLVTHVGQSLRTNLAAAMMIEHEPDPRHRHKVETDIDTDLRRLQFHRDRLTPLD